MHLKVIQQMSKVPRSIGMPPLSDTAFEEAFKGKLLELAQSPEAGSLLAEAVRQYESIDDLMGRLGSYAGLTATPYSSGGAEREQGISKAGNRRLRTVMVELAWLWHRYQPGSVQVSWFRERANAAGRRARKVMIVAMARKLLIALWRFATQGVIPEGAVLKPAA